MEQLYNIGPLLLIYFSWRKSSSKNHTVCVDPDEMDKVNRLIAEEV